MYLKRIVFICLAAILSFNIYCKKSSSTSTGPNDKNGITEDKIVIGVSAPLSGHASFLGNQLTSGSLALINEVNAKGGVHGRKIELKIYDDTYEPPETMKYTKKLIKEDKVFMLFDYVGTPTSKVIVPVVNREKIPILGLFTGAEFLRNPLQPYIFNVRASYYKEVENIVTKWIASNKKKICVFLQNDAFGFAVLAGAKLAAAKHKLEIAGTAKFLRGKLPDMKEVLKIVALKPDAVIMVGTSNSLANFVNMAKQKGLKNTEFHTVSFVGSGAFAKDLLSFKNGSEKNVFVTQVVPSPYDKTNSTVNEFLTLFSKNYPNEKPNYVALEGFINAKILIKALEKCGKDLGRGKFVQVIETMSDYNAGTGLPSKISAQNHSFFERVYISKITGDKFEVVKE